MSMTDRDRKVVLVLIPLLLLLGYWFLLLAPKRDESGKVAAKIPAARTAAESSEATEARLEGSRDSFSADYAEMIRLGKALHRRDSSGLHLLEVSEATQGAGPQVTLGLARLELRQLILIRGDPVEGDHVHGHGKQKDPEHAEGDVGAVLTSARSFARTQMAGEKVDGVHAKSPTARPAAIVWRCGSSPAAMPSKPGSRFPSGSATETVRASMRPRSSASPSR